MQVLGQLISVEKQQEKEVLEGSFDLKWLYFSKYSYLRLKKMNNAR